LRIQPLEAFAVSEKPAARRKTVDKSLSKPVKCTILLDVETHTKLAAAAAMRRVDRSTYAASILREGLRSVVCFDRNATKKIAANGDSDDQGIGGVEAA
jgi:hypothetical protein